MAERQEARTPVRELDLHKELPAIPTVELQAVDSAEPTEKLQPPVTAPPSPAKSSISSSHALGSTQHYDFSASQVSLSSMTDSFHTAPTRSRQHSVTSLPSTQSSIQQSVQHPAAHMVPFDSIDFRIEPETGPAPEGSKMQEQTDTTFDETPAVKNNCAEEVELFHKDIRIFHPCPNLMLSKHILVRLDSGSDVSFISPGTLELLGILPDSDLIQRSPSQYGTLSSPFVARGTITLHWRVFKDHNGRFDHDDTIFYISPNDFHPYGALFGKVILRGLNRVNGQPRMQTNFMNITIPPTKEEKERAERAKEEHDREVEENKRLKKEKKAAVARKAANSTPDDTTDTPQQS